MRLTLALRDDILALVDIVQQKCRDKSQSMADSTIGQLAVNDRNVISILRAWSGGKGALSMDRVARIEAFLAAQIDEDEYHAFIKARKERK